ncbi:MAG: DUF2752 domain-containing protein [Lachnospiraceae bacterium]|nr:DUF2752 domain-containing protein [Lachnospiraceae bacterium]
MFLLKIYRCPLDFFVGIPCPLCGITRAFMALAKGDVALAFYYHPLWPIAPFAAAFLLLTCFDVIDPPQKVFNTFLIVLSILLVVCFIIRHMMHSPVVQVHLESSFFGRAINRLLE